MIAAVFLLLVLASPAAADPCALIDPECITETVDETVDTVTEAGGSVKETIDETVEQGSDVVGDTTTGVIGTVKDTVDGLQGKGKDPDPGPGGGDGDKPKARGNDGDNHRRADRGADGLSGRRLEPRDPSIETTFAGQGSVLDWPRLHPAGEGGLRRAFGAAATLAFPFLLASMVLAFLVIQNRLDRKDPRLASAPLGPDVLTFE